VKRLLFLRVEMAPDAEADSHLDAALELLAEVLADRFIAATKAELQLHPEPALDRPSGRDNGWDSGHHFEELTA